MPKKMNSLSKQPGNTRLKLSNEFAEYPPINLSKKQMTALMLLFSSVVEHQKASGQSNEERLRKALEGAPGLDQPLEHVDFVIQQAEKQRTYKLKIEDYYQLFLGGKDLSEGSEKRERREAITIAKSLAALEINYSELANFKEFFDQTDLALDQEKEVLYHALIESVNLLRDTGELEVTFTHRGHKILFSLGRAFTQLAYSNFRARSKYSWGIYIFMRRKLHQGTNQFSQKEDLETFKKRFGLDQIQTYNRWFELKRKVLNVVEADCETSKDIRIKFEGIKSSKSKKITEIRYTIFQQQKSLNEGKKWNSILKKALDFLIKKGINASVAEKMLVHPSLEMEPLRGFEDVFFWFAWKYCEKHSKFPGKLAGVFVNWWNKGYLTEKDKDHNGNDAIGRGVFWLLIEEVNKMKKSGKISPEELEQRRRLQFDQAQEADVSPKPYPSPSGDPSKKETKKQAAEPEQKGFQKLGALLDQSGLAGGKPENKAE